MQTRIWNFGDLFSAIRVGRTLESRYYSQVFSGFELTTADVDEIAVAPGTGIVVSTPEGHTDPTGKILIENTTQSVFFDTTVSPQNYTLVYVHNDELISGGAPAVLTLVNGLYTSYTDGLILGWLIYPAGALALDDTMLYNAPSPFKVNPYALQWDRFADVLHPPMAGMVVSVPNIWITLPASVVAGVGSYYDIVCGLGAPVGSMVELMTMHTLKTWNGEIVYPTQVSFECEVPLSASAQMVVNMLDTAGAVHDSMTVPAGTAWAEHWWQIDRDFSGGTWTANGTFMLQWQFTLDATFSAKLGRLIVSSRDLPFAAGFTNPGP